MSGRPRPTASTDPTPSIDVVLPAEERFTPARGGAIATVSRELALALGRRTVPVRILTPASPDAPYADVEVVTLRYGRPRPVLARAAAKGLRVVTGAVGDPFERYRAEVARMVSAHTVVLHNDPVLAADLAGGGRMVVLWLHNLLTGADGAALAALPPAVRIVAVSDYVRRWTAEKYGLPTGRIAVIASGVDTDRFHPPEQWRPGDRLRVVMHARIDPNKGQVLAARAVAALREEGLPVDLTLVGAIQTFGMAQADVLAYEAEVHGAVRAAGAELTGRVSALEIPELLRRYDVALAIPTVPEPFGLAALEAMASGCALVAVAEGGLADVVGDAAVRVEPEVGSVAEGIRRLARNPDLLRECRDRCSARSLGFTWDAAAERLLEVVGPGEDR